MPKRRQQGVWGRLAMKYKIMTGIMGFVILAAGTVQAWTFLGLPVVATQAWVIEAQYSIQYSLQGLLIGQKQSRISAIKDQLVEIENKKLKGISGGERLRLELQAKELNNEWGALEAEIKSLEARPRGK